MRERSLAGRSVAAVGLGDVSFARAAARGHDIGEVTRRVHEALEASIDVIDLAPEPDVERAVGEAVRALRARDRAVVATKIPPFDRGGLPVAYVQARVEASLRATRFDGMPLVQLPVDAELRASSAWPDLQGTCERLVREGKVLAWGAIVDHTTPLVEPWLSSLAIDFSLCARGSAAVLEASATHAIFARRVLAGGALAGTLGPGVLLSRNDDRHGVDLDAIALGVAKLARFVKRPPPAARASEAARAIAETAERPDHVECETLAELALRYAIDRGAIALPRIARAVDLYEAIVAASAPPLSSWTTEQISSIFGA
jgi:aryl-alcohol dehydrogenase-like predicted oxidoreductase